MNQRTAEIHRVTRETDVLVQLNLDGSGQADIHTGIGFYAHSVHHVAHHGLFDLTVQTTGDLHIDEHHTVEDVAIALGQAIDRALGDRAGITRMADAWDRPLLKSAVAAKGPDRLLVGRPSASPSLRGSTMGSDCVSMDRAMPARSKVAIPAICTSSSASRPTRALFVTETICGPMSR